MTTRSPERVQFLADIITTAVEGGTGYWAITALYRHEYDRQGTAVEKTSAVLIEDDGRQEWMEEFQAEHGRPSVIADEMEAGRGGVLDIDAVARGIAFAIDYGSSLSTEMAKIIRLASDENDAGYIDSEAADAIAQYAILGSVVYG